MLFPEAGKGRSRRSALPQSAPVLQTFYSSFSLSFISAQNTTVVLESPAVALHKTHRWNSYLFIYKTFRYWKLPPTSHQATHSFLHHSALCLPVAQCSQCELSSAREFCRSWKMQGGKAEFLGSCREEGEWQQKYPSTWDTYTQICETSVYSMPQVTSLNNVFSF